MQKLKLPCEGVCVYSDLDGTFLDGKRRVTAANKAAIARLRELGGCFSMATGRSAYTLAEPFPEYREVCNLPMIACNGVCVYDYEHDIMLREVILDGKYTSNVLRETLERFPQLEARYYDRRFNSVLFGQRAPDPSIEFEWYKVVIYGDCEPIDEARAFIFSRYGDYFTYNKSCPNFLELLDSGASKGKMLHWLRSYYAEHGREFKYYAIGDYENDLEMIIEADVGAAPANAQRLVRDAADLVVCSNDENAVADLIGRIIAERTA